MRHNAFRSTRASMLSRAMRASRLVLGAGVVGVFAACSSETVTSPVNRRAEGLVSTTLSTVAGTLSHVTGLLRVSTTLAPTTRVQTFTAAGGQLDIPELGFSLLVPANAIPGTSLTISVTSMPGRLVAYDFQPHGTQFLKPLTIRQSLAGTNGLLGGLLSMPSMAGGYFKANSQLNLLTGSAFVDEAFPITINGITASFDIRHFSGYMVSTGRADAGQDF